MDSRRKRQILDSDDSGDDIQVKKRKIISSDAGFIDSSSDEEVVAVKLRPKLSSATSSSSKPATKRKKPDSKKKTKKGRDDEWLTSSSDSDIGSDVFTGSEDESSNSDVEIVEDKRPGKSKRGGRSSPVYYYTETSGSKARQTGSSRKSGQFSSKCLVDTFKQDRVRGVVADEMADFIVDDDEEEEEEEEDDDDRERRRRERSERKKKREREREDRRKRKEPQSSGAGRLARTIADSDGGSSSEVEATQGDIGRHVYTADKHTPASASSSGRRRRTVVDSDSDVEPKLARDVADHAGSDDSVSSGSGSGSVSGSGSGSDEDRSGSGSEESSDESLDGHALYWRLDAERAHGAGGADDIQFHKQKATVSVEQAFHLYVEMLAHFHTDPEFAAFMADKNTTPRKGKPSKTGDYKTAENRQRFLAASRQVEDVLCTYRESALGSSAWGFGEFVQSLQERPFHYAVASVSATAS
jgi:hypothetical protein